MIWIETETDVDWIKPKDYGKIDGIDERTLIKIWRLCKKEYKMIVSFILGCIVMTFILR